MPQSLANVLIHVIFSTKNRGQLIREEIADELYRYLASICRACGCTAHKIGGTENHVHIVCSLSRTIAVSKMVEEIKKSSSKWMKTKKGEFSGFAWQNGYGAFSIGQSQLSNVKRYIAEQKAHHRKGTFEEEFRAFLEKYHIPYDERYVWD